MFLVLIVWGSVNIIGVAGTSITIESFGCISENRCGCNENITIMCTIFPYQQVLYWKADGQTIAQCSSSTCVPFDNKYHFDFDTTGGRFSITFLPIRLDHHGVVFQCDEASTDNAQFTPIVDVSVDENDFNIEQTKSNDGFVELSIHSIDCVSSPGTISFEWMISETEIDQAINFETTFNWTQNKTHIVCANSENPNCGGNATSKVSSSLLISNDTGTPQNVFVNVRQNGTFVKSFQMTGKYLMVSQEQCSTGKMSCDNDCKTKCDCSMYKYTKECKGPSIDNGSIGAWILFGLAVVCMLVAIIVAIMAKMNFGLKCTKCRIFYSCCCRDESENEDNKVKFDVNTNGKLHRGNQATDNEEQCSTGKMSCDNDCKTKCDCSMYKYTKECKGPSIDNGSIGAWILFGLAVVCMLVAIIVAIMAKMNFGLKCTKCRIFYSCCCRDESENEDNKVKFDVNTAPHSGSVNQATEMENCTEETKQPTMKKKRKKGNKTMATQPQVNKANKDNDKTELEIQQKVEKDIANPNQLPLVELKTRSQDQGHRKEDNLSDTKDYADTHEKNVL